MNVATVLSPQVADALAARAPVVALETTILSHGMPYPRNVETALAVEGIVRDEGAIPASIAVLDGHISIGLNPEEIERLGKSTNVLKLSRADLAYAVSSGSDGSTTVAATMLCAHLAGIEVFATGGIGGVHRGGETSMDISADLYELAGTPVAVVCAGAKALLDLRKTLEVLETLGVPVICYDTAEFPAFWSRSSGLPAPLRMQSVPEIGRFLRTRNALGIKGGTLIANPIPLGDEIPAGQIGAFIDQAVEEAGRAGIAGKALTPWLLDRMLQLTGGRSLAANIALVQHNARLAARLAVDLSRFP